MSDVIFLVAGSLSFDPHIFLGVLSSVLVFIMWHNSIKIKLRLASKCEANKPLSTKMCSIVIMCSISTSLCIQMVQSFKPVTHFFDPNLALAHCPLLMLMSMNEHIENVCYSISACSGAFIFHA